MNTELKSGFLREFFYRGYFNDCTNVEILDTKMAEGKLTAYLGFDLTAKSLHVGSLMQLMILRLLQKYGHKPIILLGGGTTKIGDPSGKDKSRNILDKSDIIKNKKSLKTVFEKFLKFGDGESDALIVDNDEWLSNINYLEFLRDIGRHFSVNRMLTFESIKLRLEREQPLTFLEFNYMILQAYDYVVLNRKYGCTLQIGGSDQWGNILSGIDLGRRLRIKQELFGLTTPLLTTSSGKKMGKTEDGAIWLNENMYSTYDYWQFWRNTDDKDVINFLRMFTELERSEIDKLVSVSGREINEIKILLANEATALCHGKQKADGAYNTARITFEEKDKGGELPSYAFPASEISTKPLYRLIVDCNLCDTGGDAKRLIKQGAVRINDSILMSDPQFVLEKELFDELKQLKLSVGKKRHVIIELDL